MKKKYLTISELNLAGKSVLVRGDLDVDDGTSD